jgi:preprotein translocase subunit SecB
MAEAQNEENKQEFSIQRLYIKDLSLNHPVVHNFLEIPVNGSQKFLWN